MIFYELCCLVVELVVKFNFVLRKFLAHLKARSGSFLKQRLRELFRIEGLQVIRLLAEADEFDGQTEFFLDGHHCGDHWTWRSRAAAAPGEPENEAHELGIGHPIAVVDLHEELLDQFTEEFHKVWICGVF